MDEIKPICREIQQLKTCIAEKHVQAWKLRMAGDIVSVKSVHANIKASKKRIADCEWMIGKLCSSSVSKAVGASSVSEIRLIAASWCYFAFEAWVLATLALIGATYVIHTLIVQFKYIWCCLK